MCLDYTLRSIALPCDLLGCYQRRQSRMRPQAMPERHLIM